MESQEHEGSALPIFLIKNDVIKTWRNGGEEARILNFRSKWG
jgi:hypothetical protein